MYEKPPEVMHSVFNGLDQGDYDADQIVIVVDRPSREARREVDHFVMARETRGTEGVDEYIERARYEVLDGPPGWRSPCISWNAGMKHVTGDQLLIIQGDVVLTPGSVDHARKCLSERPAAYFGMVLESDPDKCRGAGHAGPVLCSSTNPRPLTYLVALPTEAVRAIGGWDEAFQAGAWYEDDDFTIRLWKHGLDFIFDDRISGIHQSHDRHYAREGAIRTNETIFRLKHGTIALDNRMLAMGNPVVEQSPGRTIWRHR